VEPLVRTGHGHQLGAVSVDRAKGLVADLVGGQTARIGIFTGGGIGSARSFDFGRDLWSPGRNQSINIIAESEIYAQDGRHPEIKRGKKFCAWLRHVVAQHV